MCIKKQALHINNETAIPHTVYVPIEEEEEESDEAAAAFHAIGGEREMQDNPHYCTTASQSLLTSQLLYLIITLCLLLCIQIQ